MSLRFIIVAGLVWGLVGGFVSLSKRRADYWRPVMERLAERSETGPVTNVRVLPVKGCGWSLGETVYGRTVIGGAPATFLMCRNRQGVRFDLTTYESRWIHRTPVKRAGAP